jgi:hypothetical protein
MKTPFSTLALVLALLSSACASPIEPATPDLNIPAIIPNTAGEPARLQISVDPSPFDSFAGVSMGLTILAFNASGVRVNSIGTVVRISDPLIASHTVYPFTYSGRSDARVSLQLNRPGTFLVTAQFGSATSIIEIEVLPDPPLSTDLVIDSFYVVEYRQPCAWECPYLVYAPIFQLRAAGDTAPFTLRGVELSIGTKPKAFCGVDVPFLPGQSRLFSGVSPTFYFNYLVLVSLDGKPLPEGTASLRLIVQGADGRFSRVEGSGPIRRLSPQPGLPTWQWGCAD